MEPSLEEERAIISLLDDQPRDMRSISQTMYDPIRLRPPAIAIAERPDDEAIIQLMVWTKAWLNRVATLGISDSVDTPPMPLLRVCGDTWFLDLAWEERGEERGFVEYKTGGVSSSSTDAMGREKQHKSKLIFMTSLPTGAPIGNTTTLMGTYKLLAAIRRLADWAEGPFLTWFIDAVRGGMD